MFCHITTHVKTDPYQTLIEEKGGRGFPHLVFMDADGNVVAKHEGDRTVAGFEDSAKKGMEFLELKKKAETGDASAKIDLLLAQLGLSQLKLDEARTRLKELGQLSKEQQEKFDRLLADLEVEDILKTVKDEKTQLEAGRKFLEMKKAGKPAPSSEQNLANYWIMIVAYAESQKDVDLFEEGLNSLKAKFGNNPNAKGWFDKQEETLKKMKENKGK